MNSNKSNRNIFDLIIVGGGISSIYLVYLLSKHKSWVNKKICVLEKENNFGGRLKVFKTRKQGINYEWDEGGARFNQNHHLLRSLIKEVGLSKNIVEAGAHIDFMPTNKEFYSKHPELLRLDPNELMNKVLDSMKNKKKEVLIKTNFLEYAPKVLTKEELQYVIDSFGYYAELEKMNAYDFYRLIRFDMSTNHSKFYGLTSKLGSVVIALIEKIKLSKMYKKGHIKFFTNQEVKSIDYSVSKKIFTIKSNRDLIWKSKKCVCAMPQKALKKLKILKPINKLLDSINCIPLCRIYSIYRVPKKQLKKNKNKENSNVWFDFMNGKVSTDSPIRFIIPVDKKKGVIMISYSDDKYADYWHKQEKKSMNHLNSRIQALTQKWVPKRVKVPKPIFTKVSYWDCGVAYWKKNVDSKKVYKKILHPYDKIPLFICGENYSLHQAWTEGALQTAKDVYKQIV